MDESDLLTPAQMAEACGVSIPTLRYYEREGLLTDVARNDAGQRRFTADHVEWVNTLRCLRVTAMPIRQMSEFAELVRAGDDAIPERLALLADHRRKVQERMDALVHAIAVIDQKINYYSSVTTASHDHHQKASS